MILGHIVGLLSTMHQKQPCIVLEKLTYTALGPEKNIMGTVNVWIKWICAARIEEGKLNCLIALLSWMKMRSTKIINVMKTVVIFRLLLRQLKIILVYWTYEILCNNFNMYNTIK